jgi:hypothetical protein
MAAGTLLRNARASALQFLTPDNDGLAAAQVQELERDMKLKVVQTVAAIGASVLLASCGGGGGSSSSAPDPSLQVAGTAAIGTALASASVEVKCATGSGTATTSGTGSYTVSIARGTLPCVVQVTGTGDTASIVLHSAVQAGSTDSATAVTTAKANVTPLTELVIAQFAATLPANYFASFSSSSAGTLTQDKLAAAATAIVAALKTAGVDLGAIDPLRGELVAASGGTAGNAYDKALDALAQKVTVDALPLLVTQVANGAASGSSTGLSDAMVSVQGGGLPGCPYVLSGNYRAIDYLGRMTLRPINFADKTFGAGDGVSQMALVQDGKNPCAFTATLQQNGQVGEWMVAFGPGGIGIYRARIAAPTPSVGITGIIFPVQAHSYADVAGTWDSLETGYYPGEGVQNYRGKMTFAADRTGSMCDYDPAAAWACNPESSGVTVTERSDGGFDLFDGGSTPVANVYAYQAPTGALALFGTTNASGSTDAAVEQTNIVLTKLKPWTLPEVGSTSKYAETLVLYTSATGTRSTDPVTSNQVTNIAVDASANKVQRKRQSDGRIDTQDLNQPIPGVRTREPGTNFSAAYQMNVTGTGLTLTTNVETAAGRWLAYSVGRP